MKLKQTFAVWAMYAASASSAWAVEGTEILDRVDARVTASTQQVITFDMVNQRPGANEPQTMTFVSKIKGERSITEFTAPGDVKGTKVLVLSASQMYIWLPEFNKVRRVASHLAEQGFMGTTFTQADLSTLLFAPVYDAAVASETDAAWTLNLTAKPGVETAYKTLRMVVTKDKALVTEIAYLDDSGAATRTQTRADYTCEGDVCVPGRIRMVDHARNGAWTELRPKEVKQNVSLSDDLFTVRALQTGR